MSSYKLIKCTGRLLGILFIFIICFFFVRKTSFYNENLVTFIVSKAFDNTSTSCHTIFRHRTNSTKQRCYPLLINYADHCCKRAQKKNCVTGLQYGMHQCVMFNKQILYDNPSFINRNRNILERRRGAGYWLWKPYIIFRELYLAQDGDIIVYSDALVNFVANISHLIRLTANQDVIVFQLTGYKESIWTKRDTFILLNVDEPEYTKTWSNFASYIVIKKSFMSMAFVSEWLTYAQDSRAITDDENVLGSTNYPDFRDHRHDQAILSLLVKKWGLTVYPDPSQKGESAKRPYPTIFDHHRNRVS